MLREFGLGVGGRRRSARLGQYGRTALPGAPRAASGGRKADGGGTRRFLLTRNAVIGGGKVNPLEAETADESLVPIRWRPRRCGPHSSTVELQPEETRSASPRLHTTHRTGAARLLQRAG